MLVGVRLTPDEYATADAAARRVGVTIPHLLRLCLEPVAPPEPKEPPHGSIVRITCEDGTNYIAERDDDCTPPAPGVHWYTTAYKKPKPWSKLKADAVQIMPLVAAEATP